MKINKVEQFSFNLVKTFTSFRTTFAFVICGALLSASMYFNGYYGWIMASSLAGKVIMAGLYASLDASLTYLSCMCRAMCERFGNVWRLLYVWCLVLVACSIFTCVSYFSANLEIKKQEKSDEVNTAIVDVASARAKAASSASKTMAEKLGDTHNNTSNWHKLKQKDDDAIKESLDALLLVKESKDGEVVASEAVFKAFNIENQAKNIRAGLGVVICITLVLVGVVLGRDLDAVARLMPEPKKQDSPNTMKNKGKTKSQSRAVKKTETKTTTDIRTHKHYARIKQAVLKRDLAKPSKAQLIKMNVGGSTAGAMLQQFCKEGLIVKGSNGYEYAETKMRAV